MKSRISAWIDGESSNSDAKGLHRQVLGDDEAREAWRSYHLIGDVLRGLSPTSSDFAAKVVRDLENEPTVLAPRSVASTGARRAMLSVAAAVAGVAWVGWTVFAPVTSPPPRTAKLETPRTIAATKSVASTHIPPPRAAADYLFAHQAYSPQVRLQGMAPYVRAVSEPGGAKGGK